MMISGHEFFFAISNSDKDSVEILINPAEMTSQKKLLVLQFEDLHFEPLINTQFIIFSELEFP